VLSCPDGCATCRDIRQRWGHHLHLEHPCPPAVGTEDPDGLEQGR
jgi:hypothetical protein